MIPFLIVSLLILLNGLFVAAEFALVGAPRAAIEQKAAQGHRAARLLATILQDPRRQDRFIATAQLGITFASLGLGMYGEHALAQWLGERFAALGNLRWVSAHSLASILAVAVLTYFHIVLGEMVAKSLALQYAERTALWIVRPMLWLKFAIYPLVAGLNATGNGVLRLLGIQRQAALDRYHTPQELEYLVRESQAGGLIRPESGQILQELFEFGELTAHEVMVPRVRVTGIPLGTAAAELRAILGRSRHTRYPVYQGDLDHIAGMVHIKDLLGLLQSGESVGRGVLRPVPYVPESCPLDAVLDTMRQQRTQLVVVMDEFGGTAGIATIEDLFEEVIGDIDEGSKRLPELYRDKNSRLHVQGTVRLDEIGEELEAELEHEDVDTVSGLVLTLLGRPAQVGDVVNYRQLRFRVVTVSGRGVGECIVTGDNSATN